MSLENYISVESANHFQELLSKDLQRVSVLNFRADWAEPCKQMDTVAKELAARHSALLFLEIEAEQLAEISESFDVESVPHFVILRGHTLLDTVNGANAISLTQAVEKQAAAQKNAKALSSTSQAPQAAPLASRTNGAVHKDDDDDEEDSEYYQAPPPDQETEEELNARCKQIMESAPIVLFMKGNPATPRCGFSNQTVGILKKQNVPFKSFDILKDESVRQQLKVLNEWPTFPQLIINGEFVGGLDVLKEMIASGEFQEMVADL